MNRQRDMSNSEETLTIFFKAGQITKKTKLNRTTITMDLLQNLFREKFPLEDDFGLSNHYLGNRPFIIVDRELGVTYDLEDVSDLYHNCVLEVPELKRQESRGQKVSDRIHQKLVIIMVGLPARGKSFIAKKIDKYLNWIGVKSKVFNVGNYRREKHGHTTADFFDPNNKSGFLTRRYLAVAALDDMVEWLLYQGTVGIFDATNSTIERRTLISSRCLQENFEVLFVESICDDEKVIESNIRDSKIRSEDYKDISPEDAINDFTTRMTFYESIYEPLEAEDLSFVKVINLGKKVIVNNVNSYLPSRIVFFLMHIHLKPKTILLTRHGESEFNTLARIGGNSSLSKSGDKYAQVLSDYLNDCYPIGEGKKIACWTSTLKRTIETTKYIPRRKTRIKALDEIDAGEFDGMTYAEIKECHPEEFQARADDKLNYRYPRGESYMDVIQRLEPLIFELERQEEDTLIVSHQATLRCLYAYLVGVPVSDLPFLTIPLHTILDLTQKGYRLEETRRELLTKKK